MTEQNTRLGIILMISTTFVFTIQDVLSRYLASEYNVWMVVMIRFWFFALFAAMFASRRPGGLHAAIRPRHLILQILRGSLLALNICLVVTGFVLLGLIEVHAILAVYPLIVVALSGPVLGERVGWRRWTAIGVGFVGVLVILQPGTSVFSPYALIPFGAAVTFASYALLTRYVGRDDNSAVSVFWTATVGAVLTTTIGIPHWQSISLSHWGFMAALCVFGALGHFLMICAYEVAEVSAIQPLSYVQLIFAAAAGILIFGDVLELHVAIGAAIVACACLFTLWRERKVAARG